MPNLAAAQEDRAVTSATLWVSREASAEPPQTVAQSTILFLHVFKCAGTSLREVFTMFAYREGWTGAVVEECKISPMKLRKRAEHLLPASLICLDRQNDLIQTKSQHMEVVAAKVLAGHFLWDFRQYVRAPYLMITTLRNPLELFVSSQQFKHRDETGSLKSASRYVALKMKARLMWEDPTDIGFIRRFLGTDAANSYVAQAAYSKEESMAMVVTAMEHLNTFWVVGVVEQYRGSPMHSSHVLEVIDPGLVLEFNSSTLGYQWQFYEEALRLWDMKCREVLPVGDHDRLCSIRR
eukprot:g7067.t1